MQKCGMKSNGWALETTVDSESVFSLLVAGPISYKKKIEITDFANFTYTVNHKNVTFYF